MEVLSPELPEPGGVAGSAHSHESPAGTSVSAVLHRIGTIPDILYPAWRDLALDASEPNSFGETWFLGAGLRAFAVEDDVRLVEVRLGDGADALLIGLMPLCLRRDYGRMRVLHVQNWGHFHTFLGTPLIRNGFERRFWTAILEALDAADWAPNFLHVHGLVDNGPVLAGLEAAADMVGRSCPIVHRSARALLASHLAPEAYYEATVRKKKRKELQRLSRRLAELGKLESRSLAADEPVEPWCEAFLALECSGWKGESGSALANSAETRSFFLEAVQGAAAEGRLQMLRLDLDERPIAMLVNFLAPPGSFSFKIAFDEAYARFSPGVLIQLDNLQILRRNDIDWMDSCAAENHPMIESLWGERRNIVRVTVRLRGFRHGLVYGICRTLETGAAWVRALRRPEREPVE
ncbi:GNAT family N-acetyltransferase [Sphingosinicella rhizophila]|uniref:GNAT family N-acetyltransferase n=1 Tax=Sphingosinicella rhizophila TaxID=3050082 RepID=A0ABU3Q8X7_9SPHN|nr:GNAT family N-acetyltransferase [Sphingosinicella sp. GR2756]MDT9599857.1 GNAT family N-acetyltransferase [Sphingosinicella sp. GR2756]